MKKSICLLALLIALVFALPGQAQAESVRSVFRVGSDVIWINSSCFGMDVVPFVENGRTYVPVRHLCNSMGIDNNNIIWDANAKYVTLLHGNNNVSLTVNSDIILINAEPLKMDVAPILRNNRLFLPARYVAEAFGAAVTWVPESQTVIISFQVAELPADSHIPSNIPATKPASFFINYDNLAFNWVYRGEHKQMATPTTKEMAQSGLTEFRQKPHPMSTVYDLLAYCSDKDSSPTVTSLALRIKEDASSPSEAADRAVAFVQSLEYISDLGSTGLQEFYRYPVETLLEKKGDCEDFSILTAVLLKEMNFRVALIVFNDHVGVGIKGVEGLPGYYFEKDGIKYYYIETTNTGWEIGDMPEEDRERLAIVLPLP